MGVCKYCNVATGYCGNFKRLNSHLAHVFGHNNTPSVPCDYDKNIDKMKYCPYFEN